MLSCRETACTLFRPAAFPSKVSPSAEAGGRPSSPPILGSDLATRLTHIGPHTRTPSIEEDPGALQLGRCHRLDVGVDALNGVERFPAFPKTPWITNGTTSARCCSISAG